MLRVGLTGGIASGKSTISKLFESLQVPVIDTDIISHQLMQPGEKGYQQSLTHFGQSIQNTDLSINRQALREIIFNNPQEKSWLENLLHPLIREQSFNRMNQFAESDYVLLVVPLLFETHFDQLVDHVIAIDCPPNVQLQRLVDREKQRNTEKSDTDIKVLQRIIDSQLGNEERLKRADSTINNADDLDRFQDVKKLHQYLLNLSQSKQN